MSYSLLFFEIFFIDFFNSEFVWQCTFLFTISIYRKIVISLNFYRSVIFLMYIDSFLLYILKQKSSFISNLDYLKIKLNVALVLI